MAKCHKGNTRHRCKKREKYVNDFYAREQELNRLINNFIKDYKPYYYFYRFKQYNWKSISVANKKTERIYYFCMHWSGC